MLVGTTRRQMQGQKQVSIGSQCSRMLACPVVEDAVQHANLFGFERAPLSALLDKSTEPILATRPTSAADVQAPQQAMPRNLVAMCSSRGSTCAHVGERGVCAPWEVRGTCPWVGGLCPWGAVAASCHGHGPCATHMQSYRLHVLMQGRGR